MIIMLNGSTRTITYDVPNALEHIATIILEAPEWVVMHPDEKEKYPVESIT